MARIRKLLVERRETLTSDLRKTTVELLNEDQVYTDSADLASAETDKSLAFQMSSRDRAGLWELDAAIRRIDEGTFGECERCDERISDARLTASPCTTLCIDCKAELESEEHRFRNRA